MSLLTLKVKAEGYGIQFSLSHFSQGKEATEFLTGLKDSRLLHLGPVQINDRRMEILRLVNRSLYNLEYKWHITAPNRRHLGMLSVEPQSGEIVPTGKQTCHLTFIPTCKMALENCRVLLEVSVQGKD